MAVEIGCTMTEKQHRAPRLRAEYYSEAEVPTEYGSYRVVVFREAGSDREHCAFVRGDVAGVSELLVRVHSECLTGEVLHSLKCDCREQLDHALRMIAEAGRGAVLYLRQEGRGIGLGNKIRAYALQEAGADTVDANLQLGFAADARGYAVAADMLEYLRVRSILLLTNNPGKVQALKADGIRVEGRVPTMVACHEHNREYLSTKRARMGHLIEQGALEPKAK